MAEEKIKEYATSKQVESAIRATEIFRNHWNELSLSIQKWLLASLITLNSGALLITINLGLHPEALVKATGSFFYGLVWALLSGLVSLIGLSLRQSIAMRMNLYSLDVGDKIEKRDLNLVLLPRFEVILSVILGGVSILQFANGGREILQSTKTCDEFAYELSKQVDDNTFPMPKGPPQTCYYYHLEGLSDDPWKRVKQEKKMLELLKKHKIELR